MPKRKTWIWILVSFAGVCLVAVIVIGIAGVVFVSRHVTTTRAKAGEAQSAFDAAKAPFKDPTPLLELDAEQRPRIRRPLEGLPAAAVKASQLVVLVWKERDEQLVKFSLPFWVLKLGGSKIELNDRKGFDLEQLNLDVNELERVGSMLVLEHRTPTGERLLIWTQ